MCLCVFAVAFIYIFAGTRTKNFHSTTENKNLYDDDNINEITLAYVFFYFLLFFVHTHGKLAKKINSF